MEKVWPVQDAKAHFSEMLETCVTSGPQMVSKRGTVAAVLVPIAEWEKLQSKPVYTAHELLVSDEFFRGEMDIPPRGQIRMRPAPEF